MSVEKERVKERKKLSEEGGEWKVWLKPGYVGLTDRTEGGRRSSA